MLRGNRQFTCDECKSIFWGLDFECNGCAFAAPVRCPKCGSWHTMPASTFWPRELYQSIWKENDEYYPKDDNSITHEIAFIPGGLDGDYLMNLQKECRKRNEEMDLLK